MGAIRVFLGWAIAVMIAVALGSVIQTQFNMASLADLGVEIGWGERLSATWHDLINFTPAYALLVSIAFALAWPVAWRLKRWLPDQRPLLFTLAGFSAIWAMIAIMNQALPVTGIAATRSLAGVFALSLCGATAGWIYTRILPVAGQEEKPA
jgi:peptidoglycan/LPS O-acetylase OafA/YrhL